MDKYLAENDRYKIHSICESVYLRDKNLGKHGIGLCIDCMYSDPEGAMISQCGTYAVIFGHHLSIYNFENQKLKQVSFQLEWIQAVHQDIIEDRSWNYFRFIAYDENDALGIFKMNVEDLSYDKVT
ncbi:MAG: hypothetical protein ACPGSD_12795 [Flavobacteriales bacterium]